MADSKQLRILKKLTAHLEGVNTDTPAEDGPNGQPYTFDLRGKIVRGRSVIPVDEAEDMVSILEFPRQEIYTPVGEHGIVRQETWMLMLQGWPKDDPENPSDPAYAMKAEVEQRVSLRRKRRAAALFTLTNSCLVSTKDSAKLCL
jgi:hypothetical protein